MTATSDRSSHVRRALLPALAIALLVASAPVAGGVPVRATTAVTAPMISVPSPYSSASSPKTRFPIRWSVPGAPGAIVESKDGQYGAWTRWGVERTAGGVAEFAGLPGHTYWFRARSSVEPSGPYSAMPRVTVPFDDRSSAMRFGRGWQRANRRGAFAGAVVRSTQPSVTASVRVSGKRVALLGTRSPKGARIAIYVDGSRRPTRIVDTRASSTRVRSVLFDRTLSRTGRHLIVVRVLSTPSRPGAFAELDGVVAVQPDTRPPTGVVVEPAGSRYTRSAATTLSLAADDNVAVAYEQVSARADFRGAAWLPFGAPAPVALPSGDGFKRVYGRVRDGAGNVSTSAETTVVVDTLAPKIARPAPNATVAADTSRWTGVVASDTAPMSAAATFRAAGAPAAEPLDVAAEDAAFFAEVPGRSLGTTGTVTFTVTDAAGNSTVTTNSVSWTAAAPAAPSGVNASAGDRTVALSWSTVGGASGYEVWRSADRGAHWRLLITQKATTFTDGTVVNGRRYDYRVCTADASGGRSAPSASVAASPDGSAYARTFELDTSAAGWDVAGAVPDAVLPIRVPTDVLERCETADYRDLSFRDAQGNALDVVARIVSRTAGNRAVGYTMSNKILTRTLPTGRVHYYTYSRVRRLESAATPMGQAVIGMYDTATGRVRERVFDELTQDNHGGYTLWFDDDGRLNAVGGSHNSAVRHYRSATAYGLDLALVDDNVSDKLPAGPLYHLGSGTYPSFEPGPGNTAHGVLRMNGTLEHPGYIAGWHYFDGSQWTTATALVSFANPSGMRYGASYDNFTIGSSDGTVYAFTHRYDLTYNRGLQSYAMYTRDAETSTPVFRVANSVGTTVTLPADEGHMAVIGSYGTTDDTRLTRVGADASGGVYCAVACMVGPRRGTFDVYRIKAGSNPVKMGTLDARGVPGALAERPWVSFSVVGSRIVALYDGSAFGTSTTSQLWMASSADWGATWSAFVPVTSEHAGPTWLPALPHQNMGGDAPDWPVPFGYQVGATSGGTVAKFAEMSSTGTRRFLTAGGLEVWALLSGVPVEGGTAGQQLQIRYGDADAVAPERPSAAPNMRMLQAFTAEPFGPFGDLSAGGTDLAEVGTVGKTAGPSSGIGWGAELPGPTTGYLSGSTAALRPGVGPMTFVMTVRSDSASPGRLFDVMDHRGAGFGVWRATDGWRFGQIATGTNGPTVSTGLGAAGLTDGRFHTIAFTRVDGAAAAYVDGVASGTSDSFYGAELSSQEPTFFVGRETDGGVELGLTGVWVGEAWSADKVRLYSRALADPWAVTSIAN